MAEIQAAREATQPIRARTGGSTFANPPGRQGLAADRRGRLPRPARGGAMVSEKHANFLINTGERHRRRYRGAGRGGAPARVARRSGIALEWEIRRIGVAAPRKMEDAP